MKPQSPSESVSQQVKVFSGIWSDKLGAAIIAAVPPRGYPMSLVGEDGEKVIAAVNQGIDAHLEACFVPDRGDQFRLMAAEGVQGKIPGTRLEGSLSPESLATLVRRLMESGDPAAESLASSICQTLGIEFV